MQVSLLLYWKLGITDYSPFKAGGYLIEVAIKAELAMFQTLFLVVFFLREDSYFGSYYLVLMLVFEYLDCELAWSVVSKVNISALVL